MRFSMRMQLIVVAVVAMCVASLVYPDPVVGDLFYTAALLLILFAAVGAIYYQGRRRAFLIGFLIFFGGYYWATATPNEIRMSWVLNQSGISSRSLTPAVITAPLLASAYEAMHSSGYPRANPVRNNNWQYSPSPIPSMPPNSINGYVAFLVVGHTIIAFGLGLLGGGVARRLSLRGSTASIPPAQLPSKRSITEILAEMKD
jgi:hypothetical protein